MEDMISQDIFKLLDSNWTCVFIENDNIRKNLISHINQEMIHKNYHKRPLMIGLNELSITNLNIDLMNIFFEKLSKYIDISFEIESGRIELKLYGKKMKLQDMPSWLKRLVTVLDCKNEFIILEDFETSMNSTLQINLIPVMRDVFKDNIDKRFLITTNSVLVARCFSKNEIIVFEDGEFKNLDRDIMGMSLQDSYYMLGIHSTLSNHVQEQLKIANEIKQGNLANRDLLDEHGLSMLLTLSKDVDEEQAKNLKAWWTE